MSGDANQILRETGIVGAFKAISRRINRRLDERTNKMMNIEMRRCI